MQGDPYYPKIVGRSDSLGYSILLIWRVVLRPHCADPNISWKCEGSFVGRQQVSALAVSKLDIAQQTLVSAMIAKWIVLGITIRSSLQVFGFG
jgi:hypothetical protein